MQENLFLSWKKLVSEHDVLLVTNYDCDEVKSIDFDSETETFVIEFSAD